MAPERIRVLFFESGHLGGSIKSLSSLLRGLGGLNCDLAFVSWYRETGPVDIFSLDFVESTDSLNVSPGKRPVLNTRTFGIPHPTGLGIRYFPIAWKALSKFRPDIAYLNNGIQPHFPALLAARLKGVPIVAHLRGARHLTMWEKPLIRYVDRFITLTKWGREFYCSEGIPAEKLHQLYNPIDLAAFDTRLNETPSFALEDGPIYAIQIGALKEPKRPALAIEALALARAECPNLQLVLAGEGPARPALERLIVDKRLAGSVHLLGHCNQIPALLARCHIGLLVSRPDYEGMGNVILESMAARLPFITWDSPVMKELVEDGATGLVAKDDSPAEIAKALVTLYKARDLRQVMGGAGREWVASGHFDPRSYIQGVRQVLEGVLQRKRR
jgi:glycosyltransferase involved in cell wall biosynthesis